MTDLRKAAQQALEALCSAVEPKKGKVYAREFELIDCYAMHDTAITALREALAQPEQEPTPWREMVVVSLVREGINKHRARELADHFAAQPEQEVSCRFCHDKGGCWAWQCYHCGEIDDVQKPTPPAAQPEPPPEWGAINNIIAEYGLQAISFVAEWKAALGQAEPMVDCPRCGHVCSSREQEPVAWGVFEGNLHDMFFTQEEAQEMAQLKGSHAEVRPLYTTPPAAQPEQEPVAFYHPHKGFYWAKPTHIAAPTVVDVPPVPLYVKWKAAQRPWVGLTKVQRDDFADAYGSYQAVCDIEQALKERNNG